MRIWKKCYTSIFAIVTLSLAVNNKMYVLFFMVHLPTKIKQRKEKKESKEEISCFEVLPLEKYPK